MSNSKKILHRIAWTAGPLLLVLHLDFWREQRPTLFFGVRWRRFTLKGAVASVLSANAVLWMGMAGWLPLGGFLPVFWALVTGIVAALVVSWTDRPPEIQDTERAFGTPTESMG